MNTIGITIISTIAIVIVASFVIIALRKFGVIKSSIKSNKNIREECNGLISQPDSLRNKVAISAIESIILKDNSGAELALTRPETAQLANRKFREICVCGTTAIGQIVQGAMPLIAKAQTLHEIAKIAPNGLFTATGSIKDLMKYTDGTVGSIVMRGKKITGHAGFTEVALKTANPVAVLGASMQAMALISGQYFMNEISKQLKSVDQKLDKLISYHHDEKIGVLRNISRELLEVTSKANVDAADNIACQSMGKQCGEIYYEYYTRLEHVNVAAKERWFNKNKELRELGISVDGSEINFSIQMCYHASLLREKSKLAEIAVRLKIGEGQERFISEQIQVLRKLNDEAFHRNVHKYIEEYYAPLLEKAEKIADSKKLPSLFGDVTAEVSNIQRKKDAILKSTMEDDSATQIFEKMILFLTKPQETLILISDTPDSRRVFVSDDEVYEGA
jgi:hypothetical protein